MSFSSASRKGTPAAASTATLASGGTPGPGDVTTTEEFTADNALADVTVS